MTYDFGIIIIIRILAHCQISFKRSILVSLSFTYMNMISNFTSVNTTILEKSTGYKGLPKMKNLSRIINQIQMKYQNDGRSWENDQNVFIFYKVLKKHI